MFCSISIDDFVKNTVKNNKDINKKELQESVKDAVIAGASWVVVEQDSPSMGLTPIECAKTSIEYLKTIM